MLSAITTYMPRWLMAIIATALVLATVVGSSQNTAEAIDPADTDTVYIADGTNFADALVGATIASLNTSPMLGVAGTNGGDTIPDDTVVELDRLTNNKNDPLDTIYIFGGTSAVSADVQIQLDEWANDIQRIEGDSRWGTYQAISQMLPSAVDEAVHAQEADHATEADNADTLDGNDSSDFLGANDKAADSDLLDGEDSSAFVAASGPTQYQMRDWEQITDTLKVSESANEFEINNADCCLGDGELVADPDLPKQLFGEVMAVSEFELCYMTRSTTWIEHVSPVVYAEDGTDQGAVVADASDDTGHTDDACRTYAFDSPVALTADRYFHVTVGVADTHNGPVELTKAVVTLVPSG